MHPGGATSGNPAQALPPKGLPDCSGDAGLGCIGEEKAPIADEAPVECRLDPGVEFNNRREEAELEAGAQRAEGPQVLPLLVMPRFRTPAVPRRPSISL